MNLTGDQHTAVYTHDRNLIVVAGAGSGKTRVLVERYLALLDANPDWPLNALVAITFTRKAAGEMRDRVRTELENRRQAAGAADIRRRWSDLLAAMDTARIDTIHGLCATILRANAAEAGVDPDFAVLEETDAHILLEDVIDDVLRALVVEHDAAIALFTEYERAAVRAILSNPDLLNADLGEIPPDIFERWQTSWEQEVSNQIEHFKRAAESMGTWQPAAANDKLSENWQFCLDCLDSLYGAHMLADHLVWLQAIASINLQGGSARVWGGKDVFEEAKAALRAIRDCAKTAVDAIGDPPGELDRRAAELLPLWTRLLGRVQTAYREAKDSQGLLDFNDLETRTRRLLIDHPDVCVRYRNAEFRHLLVDEFQDTNATQWDIIRALADLETPGSLFVVGDSKQSIYAFRGADVSVFGGVQGQILELGGQAVPLARSFRTHEPLVNCFNALFGALLVPNEDSPVKAFEVALGEPMTAERITPPSDAPAVELLLIDTSRGDDRLSAEEARRWEAFEIARRLQDRVTTGTLVFDKETRGHRPLQYGDIAILFQSTTQITLYEDVFKAVGLPFVTIAGRGYYSRQEVWDLLNLLRSLYNPADNLSLAAALRSPLFSLSDNALLGLRLHRDADGKQLLLWDALDAPDAAPVDELEQVAFARDCLYELHELAGRVTISELLRAALSRTGFLATLTGLPDGARRRGNVEKLVEKAQSSGKITLGTFSQYISDLSAREVREGEAPLESEGVVSLMTVHASKGLEFPLVVLADASWSKAGGGADAVYFDAQFGLTCKVYDAAQDKLVSPYCHRRAGILNDHRETAERKRLFYVAATRAQDYILVSGRIGRTKEGGFRASGWLAWLWNALQIESALEQQREGVLFYQWGELRVMFPEEMPPDDVLTAHESDGRNGWDSDPPAEWRQPALLGVVAVARDTPARHLAATQIGDLGGAIFAADAQDRRFHHDRLIRKLLYDAPATVQQVSERKHNDTGRQIGEIVHQALQHWRFPGADDDLETLLHSYAWKQGIIEPGYLNYAVRESRRLLGMFAGSEVYRWVESARLAGRPVLAELPFIYRTDSRIIHGVIDLLLLREDGTWALVDYKTAVVKADSPEGVADHARRFHLQVGVYAAAVQAQLGGIIPATYIHYIRHGQTVAVSADDWRAAQDNLESLIGNVVWVEE